MELLPTRSCSVLIPGIRVCRMRTKGFQCPPPCVPTQAVMILGIGTPEAAVAMQWLVSKLEATALILFAHRDRPE